MANSLSSPCFVTNFEYSLDPIPSHRLSSSNTGSFSPSSSCARVEGESAAVGLSSAPRKSEHALSVFCFFAERCGDKRRVVRRLLPWRHGSRRRPSFVTLKKSCSIFIFVERRRRGTSERFALDQTTKLSECQPIHPISPSRHVSRVSDYSETTQVMNTRIRILFKS